MEKVHGKSTERYKNKTKEELKAAVIADSGMGETTFKKLFKLVDGLEGVTLDTKTKRYSYTKPHEPRLN
jgi:hypothetical protein